MLAGTSLGGVEVSRSTSSMVFSRPPAEIEAPVVVGRDDDCIFGYWRRLLVIIFRRETTLEVVSRTSACIREHSRGENAFVGAISIVEKDAPLPDPGVRSRISSDMLLASSFRFSAMVYEGSGFRAAAVRGVIISIGMFTRLPFPHRTFSTVADASVWTEGRARAIGVKDLSSAHIRETVRHLRWLRPMASHFDR